MAFAKSLIKIIAIFGCILFATNAFSQQKQYPQLITLSLAEKQNDTRVIKVNWSFQKKAAALEKDLPNNGYVDPKKGYFLMIKSDKAPEKGKLQGQTGIYPMHIDNKQPSLFENLEPGYYAVKAIFDAYKMESNWLVFQVAPK